MQNLVEDFLQYLRHERGQSDNTANTRAERFGKTVVRIIFLVGVLLILASPFLDEWAAYLDGRNLRPFLSFELDLDLFWFALVIGLFLMVLLARALFGKIHILLRLFLAFGILAGSPVYFFTVWGDFCAGSVPMHLRGMAAAARENVNCAALEKWAVEILRNPPAAAKVPPEHAGQLDWHTLSSMPAEARSFFGITSNTTASFESLAEGRNYIHIFFVNGGPVQLLLGDSQLAFPTNGENDWNYRIAPGVYLDFQAR